MQWIVRHDKKTSESKEKDKLYSIKIKNFYTSTKMKRQTTEWEKLSENHISDNSLVYLEYKKNTYHSTKNVTNLKNGQKDINRHFS